MPRIMLVEDDEMVRLMATAVLELDGYEVVGFPNGSLALRAFLEITPDLIVSDISMPVMDGYTLLDEIRKLPKGTGVPFLFLSGHSERDNVIQARQLGADDYLFKPFQTDDLLSMVKARLRRRELTQLFDTRHAHLQTITMLARAVEARDAYTGGHVERVQQLAIALGQALKWSAEELAVLEYGALLHDIGKIAVPDAILNKPGKLTSDEWEIMSQHTRVGAKFLGEVDHLQAALPYLLYHHERWDGLGYPEGLAGLNIPKEGRLLAIVDVFDALVSDRSYHSGVSTAQALETIKKEAGAHFDPQIAAVFVDLQKKNLL